MFFLSLLAFFLPISKAVIECSATICIITWFVKKILVARGKSPEFSWPAYYKSFFTEKLNFNHALFLFLFVNLVSAIFSSVPRLSMNAFFFKLLEYVLIFVIIRDTIKTKLRYQVIGWILCLSLFFIGFDGVFQIFTKHDLFRHRGLFQGRVTASFINPNDLGSYLITLIPLVLAIIFVKFNAKIRALLIIGAILVVSILVLTFSKGAIFAFILALIFFGGYFKKRYTFLILLFFIAMIILLPLLFNPYSVDLVKRILFFASDAGAIDRKFLWSAALRMFIAKPIFGVGLGTFMENYHIFWVRPTGEIAYAHNCYLQTLAETGIIGLGAFLLLLFIWLRKTLEILSKPFEPILRFSFIGLSVGLIAYLLNSFVDTNFYSLSIAMLFWFILGLQQALGRIIKDEKYV